MKSVIKAVLKGNKVICRKCGEDLGRILDYGTVQYKGQSYTEFIRECSNLKCGNPNQYCINLNLDSDNERFIFDSEELEEVIEDEV